MECQCAFIETLCAFCNGYSKTWCPSTQILLLRLELRWFYLPSPDPVVYVAPLPHILGKMPLVLARDHGTISSQFGKQGNKDR
jgi:hypothetical protein